MKITIFCTLQFEAFHRWPDAPIQVGYLASLHRHIFHVRAEKRVQHDDRDIEFITLKNEMQKEIRSSFDLNIDNQTWSCEQWAIKLIEAFDLSACEVSEDGENGARVER